MFLKKSSSLLLRILEHQRTEILKFRKCHSLFGVKELLQREKVSNFRILQAKSSDHDMAVEVIKRHYLSEHIMVRARRMDLNDRALDEYLISMLKQGNTLYAKTEDGEVAGVCINFASSHVDPRNLRLYAYYRQAFNLRGQSSIAAGTRSMSISAAALIKVVLSDSKLG
ncbi:hypothetical protein evm_007494 [Chilo suppressalis]|nr:hypothetical protein evm_007494 [Chilo suppressalis]